MNDKLETPGVDWSAEFEKDKKEIVEGLENVDPEIDEDAVKKVENQQEPEPELA